MNLSDPSMALLASSGGDTVKLFDVSVKAGDPCILSYTPSPGCLVNSLKWNHTNLVVASAGDDKKISLWRKNGQSMGTIPVAGTDSGDNIEESIMAISFSNKVSRYICSGGSGQVVRIWDLQRKRCIKWLRGHTNTITGAMYNCKDEHLASISLSGDLILHNLASGARATELKDPNQQVLRVLDYSRISRHLLVTAGDDGTLHLWDTTGRNPKMNGDNDLLPHKVTFRHSSLWPIAFLPAEQRSSPYTILVEFWTSILGLIFSFTNWSLIKSRFATDGLRRTKLLQVSWLKQHSAPTAGISFSPSNDKIIASVGLDKKLYTYDSGSRRPSSCIPYEAPFSSLAFRDDGWTLAAGTSSGRVVFYDVRGKPQPFVVLHAYSSSEAVTSLCWQRSKPVIVNESNCTAETALVGDAVEDSILMPDPLPSVTSSNVLSTSVSSSRNSGRFGASVEASSLTAAGSGFASSTLNIAEETPQRSHLWPGGSLARLHAPRSSFNFKDEMEVFSPLVDVQPITPSLDKLWDDREGTKKDHLLLDKKPSSLLFPQSSRRFPIAEEGGSDHPIFDWKPSLTSKQDDNQSSFTLLGSTPTPSSKNEDSSITPPEAWGGERPSEKYAHMRQPITLPSRFGMLTSGGQSSGSMFSGLQDLSSSTSQMSISSLTNSNLTYVNLRPKDVSSNQETSLGFPDNLSSSSVSLSLATKGISGQVNFDSPSLALPRRFSTYAERISTASSFSDGTSLSVGSPKMKKTGAETREELLNSLLAKSDTVVATEAGILPSMNGGISQPQKAPQPDAQQGSSFTLQLFQRTLEETLDSFQKSIHEDMRNLHIEILRQFHMQEMEMSSVMSSIMENQAELMKEVKSLRKENQQLRQLL